MADSDQTARIPADEAGTIRRRRALPGSRAAVGGLLVTVAVLGTWYVSGDRGGGPSQQHVVAAVDLAAGHRLTPDDLGVIDVDLPADHRARTFGSPDELVDALTLGPIGAGEILQEGSVGIATASDGAQFSFAVEQDWALAGDITVGDRIDVYATDRDERTDRVLTNVPVHAISARDDLGPGGSGRIVITVGDADADSTGRIIGPMRSSTLTVVRVTHARSAGGPTAAETSVAAPDVDDEEAGR